MAPLKTYAGENSNCDRSHVFRHAGMFTIKGTAERIPGQTVGFVLYAYDGCPAAQTAGCQAGPDRLRIVVWDTSGR
jgi:hypothetical protein